MPDTRTTRPAARTAARRPASRSVLWRYRRAFFLVGLVGLAALAGVAFVLWRIPLPGDAPPPAQTTVIYDVRGDKLAEFHADQDRTVVASLDDVSPALRDAVIAAEDQDFFRHGGVDPFGIARATWADVRGSGALQGGSTITQQYVKNGYNLTRERRLSRKVKEAVMAVKLEKQLTKDEILRRYLNIIYFGRGAYGIQAAARTYFEVDARDLDLSQSAYLAGLIRAPELADVVRAPVEAERRRRVVLDAMVRERKITSQQAIEAQASPLATSVRPRPERIDPVVSGGEFGMQYFVEYVRRQLAQRYGENRVFGGGLRVYTTIDPAMQRAAYRSVTTTLNRPDDPAAALVAVDTAGEIKAMVGGTDWERSKVNLAVGAQGGGRGRQPGSTFKPFVLATAVREGYSVQSAFKAPAEITLPKANAGKDWRVVNYEEAEQGTLSLIDATRVSSNTVYAQLVLAVGAEKVQQLAGRLGVKAELPVINSLALGTADVSVLDMASGYSTFARRGVERDPIAITKVTTASGALVDTFVPESRRVLTENEADTVTTVLRQVVERGTGTAARIGRPAAGKTGTTQGNGDAWFVGYTPNLTAAVWMGYPEGQARSMKKVHGITVTGGSFPAQIWRKFMIEATKLTPSGGSFTTVRSFPGRRLNPSLVPTPATSSTTSTSVTATTSSTSVPASTSSTTSTTLSATTTVTDRSQTGGREDGPGVTRTSIDRGPGRGG